MQAMMMAPDPEKTVEDVAKTWAENGDFEEAAADNGYPSVGAAFAALGIDCAFDTENEFTRKYMRAAGTRARNAAAAGDFSVI